MRSSLSLTMSMAKEIKISNAKLSLLQLDIQKPIVNTDEINNWIGEIENVQKSSLSFPSLWNMLDGKWLLRYSNNVSSLRGLQNDSQLLNVQQVIEGSNIENVLSFGSGPFETKVVLKHSARVQSTSTPALLSLDLDGLDLRIGSISIPSPPIPLPDILRRGFFEVCLNRDHFLLLSSRFRHF